MAAAMMDIYDATTMKLKRHIDMNADLEQLYAGSPSGASLVAAHDPFR